MTEAEKLVLLTEALQNMMGAFDTPVARRQIAGEFAEACRLSGRQALTAVGADHPAINGA